MGEFTGRGGGSAGRGGRGTDSDKTKFCFAILCAYLRVMLSFCIQSKGNILCSL